MSKESFAELPPGPCYAVIFSSRRTSRDDGYDEMARCMEEAARRQPGFLGLESVRGGDGFGITVSYWENEEAIADWKADEEHRIAQTKGRTEWYARYEIRVARVERAYGFGAG